MAVDSVNRFPTLHVPQSNDTGADKKRREEKGKKQKNAAFDVQNTSLSEDPTSTLPVEGSQILDSVKTVQLLTSKPFEPKTAKNHAFQEMTQMKNVKNPTLKKPNKLNKSA